MPTNKKTTDMLTMLMKTQYDDIRDAEMLADYAMQAKSAGADSMASFFAQRAKSRITSFDDTQRHVDNIMHEMHDEKDDATADPFRCAYTEHLAEWVQKIKDKISRM